MTNQPNGREVRHVPTPGYETTAPTQEPQFTARPAPAQYAGMPGGQPAPYQDPYAVHQNQMAAIPPVPHHQMASAPAAVAATQGRPVAPPPPAVAEKPANTVELKQPIMVQGEELRRITFRKPGVRDIRMNGYPLRNALGPDGRVVALEELPDIVAKYISVLAETRIPPTVIDGMDVDDFAACSQVVLGFFMN